MSDIITTSTTYTYIFGTKSIILYNIFIKRGITYLSRMLVNKQLTQNDTRENKTKTYVF